MFNKRTGFIIAGHVGANMSDETARTIEVLATSRAEAIEAVEHNYPEFTKVGIMTEAEIHADLAAIRKVKKPGETGYMVAGYVGESLTEDTAIKIASSGVDEDSAIVAAMDSLKGFLPVGVLSEEHLEIDLEHINLLRNSVPV
jgi:predicted phage tail protein